MGLVLPPTEALNAKKNEFIEIVIGLITRLKCRPLSTVILENLAFVVLIGWREYEQGHIPVCRVCLTR